MIVCMHKKPSGNDCGKRAIVSVPSIEVIVAGHDVALQLCYRHARCAYVRKLRHEKIEHLRKRRP